jgi:hypothetical protein
MGFGDKFKNLARQAQDAVVEHKDQIHQAVDAVGVAADRKTKGKYTTKIAKFGEKAGEAIDKLGGEAGRPGATSQNASSTAADHPPSN